jgi:YD repeat-containing protein
MAGPNEFYAADDHGFVLIQVSPDGSTYQMKVASAEDAAPAILDQAIAGYYHDPNAPVRAAASALPAGDTVARGIVPVEQAAYADIMSRDGLTETQKYETLHRVLGDNPTVIKAGYDTYGADVASRIWGPASADTATVNSTERSAEGTPSNVIQNSGAQGVGWVPPGGSSRGNSDSGLPTGNADAPDTQGQGTASSPANDAKTGGDPLILVSGQLYIQVTDFHSKGRGIHFSFTRTYLHQALYRGPMGFCWDHCYNLWLREAQELQLDGTFANVVYRSNGAVREDRFTQVDTTGSPSPSPLGSIADVTFRGPPGYFDELSKTAGTYTMRMVNGTVVTYNDDLRVDSIADKNGNTLRFFYQDNLLKQVVDAVGKIFDFVNDDCGRLVQVLDRTGGRRLGYAYDDIGNLIEADIFGDESTAGSTDYIYLGMDAPAGMEHCLSEAIDAGGNTPLAVTYGTDFDPWNHNRVVEQRSDDGLYSYTYGPADYVESPELADQLNVARNVTTVTYPNGHIIEHAFNAQGNVVRRREEISGLTDGSGTLVESLISLYTYNREGLLAREVRADGATVSYEYAVDRYEALNGFGTAAEADASDRLGFGNLLRRAETARVGTGETRQLITTWTYLSGGELADRQRGPYYADPTGVELPGQATPTLRYVYDANGRLIRVDYDPVKTADGGTQTLPSNHFTYDAHGSLTGAQVDAIRSLYEYFPDTLRSGFVRRYVEDADGLARETFYEADDLGRVTAVHDSLGGVSHWEYNGFDLVTRTVQPMIGGTAPEATLMYDRMRRVKRVTETVFDADGTPHPDGALVHSFRYDANNRVVETRSGTAAAPDQRRRQTLYHPWGQPRRMLDESGVASDLHYDSRNLLARVTFAVGTSVEAAQHIRYNRSGELSSVLDALGHETRIERDGFGRVSRVTDRDGNAWVTGYDAQDRAILRRLIGPAPGATPGNPSIVWSECRQDFDAYGRLIRRTDKLFVPGDATVPRDLVTHYFYDQYSRLAEVRDGMLLRHRFSHDGLGRLVRSEDGDGNSVQNNYDDAGHRLAVIRAELIQGSLPLRSEYFRTEVLYDGRGLPLQELDAIGNITQRSYDSRRLIQRVSTPDGRVASYRYDIFGQLRDQSVQAGATTVTASRQYDPAGRLIAMITPNGDRTEWQYDARGWLTAAGGPNVACTYTHDLEGRTVEQVLPSALRLRSQYSPEGRLLLQAADATGYQPPRRGTGLRTTIGTGRDVCLHPRRAGQPGVGRSRQCDAGVRLPRPRAARDVRYE